MKAIALISEGLDSLLAARLIEQLGIEVIGIKFKIPFYLRRNQKQPALSPVTKEIDIGEEFLKMFKGPAFGYGANMNPCIDCKILMLTKTKELMVAWGAAFVVTGEVLGQRPMSQHKQALEIIARKAGLEGLVLRPLSARLLTETLPEIKGWVDRSKLLDYSGRSRKPQIALAKAMGISAYSQPAGGCLLTDPAFSRRLKDLISHEPLTLDNVELLKIGRHFRLSEKAKLVVGRDEEENMQLLDLAAETDYLFMPADEIAGPTAVGRGVFNRELIGLAASMLCYYSDLNGKMDSQVFYREAREKESQSIEATAIEEQNLAGLRI